MTSIVADPKSGARPLTVRGAMLALCGYIGLGALGAFLIYFARDVDLAIFPGLLAVITAIVGVCIVGFSKLRICGFRWAIGCGLVSVLGFVLLMSMT